MSQFNARYINNVFRPFFYISKTEFEMEFGKRVDSRGSQFTERVL
jgi:hypothetical protein